jgi:hypothetical protein
MSYIHYLQYILFHCEAVGLPIIDQISVEYKRLKKKEKEEKKDEYLSIFAFSYYYL